MEPAMISTFLAGLAFGAVSLVSIGPNNILLLREGLAGRRPGLVAGVMWLSYAGLLGLAVFAGHSVSPMVESVATLLAWGGAMVLAAMGVAALRSSARPAPDLATRAAATEPAVSATARVLRVVWLNPLTYLELLAIPAALALPLGGIEQRCALFAGLLLAFALNCFGFSLGASLLSPLFGQPSRLRLFDRVSGGIMMALAVLAATHAALPKAAQEDRSLAPVSAVQATLIKH
jgi:L-lysine exporter family protein LysE/ArgO